MFIRFEFKIFPPFLFRERERERKSKKGNNSCSKKEEFSSGEWNDVVRRTTLF